MRHDKTKKKIISPGVDLSRFLSKSEFEKRCIVGVWDVNYLMRQISGRLRRTVSSVLQCWFRLSEGGIHICRHGSEQPKQV